MLHLSHLSHLSHLVDNWKNSRETGGVYFDGARLPEARAQPSWRNRGGGVEANKSLTRQGCFLQKHHPHPLFSYTPLG